MNEMGPDGWIQLDRAHGASAVIREIRNRIESLEIEVMPQKADAKERIRSLCKQLGEAITEMGGDVEVKHAKVMSPRLDRVHHVKHSINVVIRKEEVL